MLPTIIPASIPSAAAAGTPARPEAGLAPAPRSAPPPTTDRMAASEAGHGHALDDAAAEAGRALFPEREVDVNGFYDEASHRFVYRVADRRTGEVLIQTPPDELLRFYASARADDASPILKLRA